MEDDFLDLGFVDSSIFNDVEDSKDTTDTEEETRGNQKPDEKISEEDVETNDSKPSKGEENKEVVENPVDVKQGSPNISSSIAKALAEDGVLQTLDEERISKINDAESLIEAFREDQRNQLDEITKRVHDALTYGIEPTRIQQYEQWIRTLDSISDDFLETEGEENENYRKNLIFQHYRSKGFDEDDAREMVERSIENGKDIDDSKKALTALKKVYKNAYDSEIFYAKKEYENHIENQKKQYKDLKESIIEDKENFYEQFEIGKGVRQKIFDVVAKPSVQDGDSKITPLQKFIKDDPNKANKIIGTLFVITEGFTKFDSIMKGTVKKEMRKSVQNLERVLAQTRVGDGSMNFKTGLGEDNSNLKIVDFDLSAF